MVRVLLLIASIGLSGCGMKHWLGESPPPTKIVSKADASSQSGPGGECASWTKIYAGSEEESASTFECWAAKEPDVWKKIHGDRPDELTDRQIGLLIHDGVIAFDGGEAEKEFWYRRLIAIKNLLGFGSTVTRARADRWIAWFRAHRADIRQSYERMTPIGKTNAFAYSDLQAAALTAASFLRELEWNKTSTELAPLIRDTLAIKDKQISEGVEPGLRVLRNLLGFACPLQSDPARLVTNEIANCFENASAHFKPSSRWVEFLFNDKGSILEPEAAQIERSILTAAPLMDSWFSQAQLKPLDARLWLEWAKALGAHPPDNFLDSLKMIRRLNTRSNEYFIYPTEMNRVFAMIKDYENLILDAIPHFSRAYRSHSCKNPDAASWKQCVLSDWSVRDHSKTIDMLLRVKDPRHGMDAVPVNGSVMSAVAFFDAAAKQMIELFDDDKDGVISIDIGPEDNELVTFITSSIETYQAVDHYISNLGTRLNGGAVEDGDNISISQWNLKAFAKLIASANSVLVERTESQRNLIEKVLANVANTFPRSTLFLDRPAITAILTTLTSLPHYRQVALEQILGSADAAQAAMNDGKPFSREIFRAHIGDMLKKNFPRTFESCNKFGFEQSCFIGFDEVMPSPDDPRKLVSPGDIDVVTLLAIGMEGVFDTCGAKKDGTLSYSILDGDDDLDCGFNKMKGVVIPLLDSGIIHLSTTTKRLAEVALNAIDSMVITRTIGKVALIRGTKRYAFLNMPLFWAYGKTATIGSSYGLLSDIVASDRVDEVKKKSKAK